MDVLSIRNRNYHTIHIRELHIEEDNLFLEFSNGDTAMIYDLTEKEKSIVIKFLNNDSRANINSVFD